MSGPPFGTEEIVAMAAADPDLRILRLSRAPAPVAAPRGALLISCCAIEGLRFRGEQRLSALSLRPFRTDVHGMIVEIGTARRWTATRAPREMRSRSCEQVCDAEAATLLADAELIVAHDARAIRMSVERSFALAVGRPWASPRHDLDWAAIGLEGGTLQDLLRQTGHFLGADDPESRVEGLLRLLAHRPEPLGVTLLGRLLRTACRSTWFVEVEDVPLEGERKVAEAGYVLIPGTRRWWREVDGGGLDAEVEWLTWEVCDGAGRPRVREIGWRTRHSIH